MTTTVTLINEMRQALSEAEARLEYTHALLRELRELQAQPIAPELFDYKHEDAISYNMPEGYDTVLGYLAKNHPDVLDLIDYYDPEATQRDGWKLSHMVNRTAGAQVVYVEAPKCLQTKGIFTVRAYPVSLLQQRWG